MKKYIDPLDSMRRDAGFVAFVPPARMHETHSAAQIEQFREHQRGVYRAWRYRSN